MTVKDAMLNLYDSMLDCIKSCHELANIEKRAWAKQNQFNNNVVMFAAIVAIAGVVNEIKEKKQNQKIEALTQKIEELEKLKGE